MHNLLFPALISISLLISGCMEVSETSTQSKPATKPASVSSTKPSPAQPFGFSSQAQAQQSIAQKKQQCASERSSSRQGAGMIGGVLGGDLGRLAASATASAADEKYRSCMQVVTAMTAQAKKQGFAPVKSTPVRQVMTVKPAAKATPRTKVATSSETRMCYASIGLSSGKRVPCNSNLRSCNPAQPIQLHDCVWRN